jgi:hypothetical protein
MRVTVNGTVQERPISHYEDFPTLGEQRAVPVYDQSTEFISHYIGDIVPNIVTMKRDKKIC